MNRQQRRAAAHQKPRQPPKHIKHNSLLQDKGRQRIDPHNFALMAVSNKPLDDELIQQITAAYQTFIDHLKSGNATDQMFYQACENLYLYVNFCEVLLAARVNADLNVELLFKTELSINKDTAINQTTAIFEAIAERKKERNKWIATGDEIKHLEQSVANYRQILSLASWQHYIAAAKQAEPKLQAAIRRNQKKQG